MRQLVVDVGNTSTALGMWSDGRVTRVRHADGPVRSRSEAFAIAESYRGVARVAYCSVVPSADAGWRRWASRRGIPLHAVSHRDFAAARPGPLPRLDYPHPETIGADRLADAAGVVARYGAPVLVMDFGTALTAAVVTADNVWRGGVIAPGFPLMSDYFFERTAKLPRLELGKGREPRIGRSTEEAMRLGAMVGYRGMVHEIVRTLERNFGCAFRHVATGGYARWALGKDDLGFVVDPTLTLFGTGLIASLS